MRRILRSAVAISSLGLLSGCPIVDPDQREGEVEVETGPRYWAVELNGQPLNGSSVGAEVTLEARDNRGDLRTMGFTQFGIELLSEGRLNIHSAYRREEGSGSDVFRTGFYSRSGEQITFSPEYYDMGFEATGTLLDPTMTLQGHWIQFLSGSGGGNSVFVRFPVNLVLRREETNATAATTAFP